MKAHRQVQLFLPLAEFSPDREDLAYELLFGRPRTAARACKRILRRFPKLCKFLLRVCEEFGRQTVKALWCRIWGTLEEERAEGMHRIEAAFANMADPDDRVVCFRHDGKGDDVVASIEALEQLAFA